MYQSKRNESDKKNLRLLFKCIILTITSIFISTFSWVKVFYIHELKIIINYVTQHIKAL